MQPVATLITTTSGVAFEADELGTEEFGREPVEWTTPAAGVDAPDRVVLYFHGGVDPYDPRHSPVYRDLRGLSPLLIQAVGRDMCHDDSVRLAVNARAAGVTVKITEYADVEHIWILNGTHRIRYPDDQVVWVDVGEEPPEAVAAVEEMCAFVRERLHR